MSHPANAEHRNSEASSTHDNDVDNKLNSSPRGYEKVSQDGSAPREEPDDAYRQCVSQNHTAGTQAS